MENEPGGKLGFERERTINIMNLNHPEKMTVAQIVRILAGERHFDYVLEEGEEEWPVKFWGDTEFLAKQLKVWKMEFPELKESLRKRFASLKYEDLVTPSKEVVEKQEKRPAKRTAF